jgi:hypothetical protein
MGCPSLLHDGIDSAASNILSTNYPQGAFGLFRDLLNQGSKGTAKVTCRNSLTQYSFVFYIDIAPASFRFIYILRTLLSIQANL